jgi:hypothetical protein
VESGISANGASARVETSHPVVDACATAEASHATTETWPALEVRRAGETAMKAAGNAAGVAPIAWTECPVARAESSIAWTEPSVTGTESSETWTKPSVARMKSPETAIEPSESAMASKPAKTATKSSEATTESPKTSMEAPKAAAAMTKAESWDRTVHVQRDAEHQG